MKQYKIQINRREALRYLGYHGNNADTIVSGQLNDAVTLLEKVAKPAYIYKVFKLLRSQNNKKTVSSENNEQDFTYSASDAPVISAQKPFPSSGIGLKGTSILLTGTEAASFLEDCERCIMIAVTIGHRVDEELRRHQITDMSSAVILDSCASSAVESICSQLEIDLETEYESRGFFLTDRFSPGYGDLPLDLQPAICRALSTEKTIGLSTTSGMLMTPTKSVTAFIGIANRPQPKRLSGCIRCRMNETCNFRKAGTTCAQ